MNRRLVLLLSLALAIGALISPDTAIAANGYSVQNNGGNQINALYPSYLLLSNWANESVLIRTGIPILNAFLDGLTNGPPSILNIYVGPYGLLPLTVNFSLTSVSSAVLNVNNTITITGNQGTLQIFIPPYSSFLVILSHARSPYSAGLYLSGGRAYQVSAKVVSLKFNNLTALLCTNASIAVPSSSDVLVNLSDTNYLILSFNSSCSESYEKLANINDERVSEWLLESKKPPISNSQLVSEYFMSLLVLKDDQNPYLGDFAASPSPIYLYSWVRDSSFAAMALQAAGHYKSALKYWLWMASATRYKPGVWYTRYDFYTGQPDTSFGLVELDSLGLFEIGIYQYFELTHNTTFLNLVMPALNSTVSFQVSSVLGSKVHLIPEDLSVWEDRLGYHFWTQAINYIGMLDALQLLEYEGTNSSALLNATKLLNEGIIKYFWNGTTFYSDLTPEVLFTSNGTRTVMMPQAPMVSSSSLLPLALDYTAWHQNYIRSDVSVIIRDLWNNKVGGLARFYGDDYHYDEYLYDSSGPMPPWIITTLFLVLYYNDIGNYSGSLSLLSWAYTHSQHGLLPEAIDPNTGLPLPTTSPLTWSSAMYVIDLLGAKPNRGLSAAYYIAGGVALAAVIAVAYLLQRASASRIRQYEGAQR